MDYAPPPLKEFRENHEPPLSQGELAEMLNVSRVSVTRWESGERKIDEELVLSVSEKTGIPPERLRPDLAALFSGAAT